ncbi:MAG: dTDP-glucose 4,6-dehydratase [Candidatus Neomarinimicrobiota bacterium]
MTVAKTYLVTGGAGFIGSNFIRFILNSDYAAKVINLDKLTYAGNPHNLADFTCDQRYIFIKGDICDATLVGELFERYKPDYLVNFAAESHVDRSIGKPDDFIRTDVFGAFTLLEAARLHGIERFIQISTDEVYGSIIEGSFRETDQLMPSNPYSASKAGADRLAYSYFKTYDLPVIITRASNNFGPYQYPEKLIPLFVTNAIENKPLPLYGDGQNIRDWLYVEDHCSAIQCIIEKGQLGEVYNIGGGNERQNIAITSIILRRLNKPETLIKPVTDRLGHDRRYSIDGSKLRTLGWEPEFEFEPAMRQTIDWYVNNPDWWQPIKSGEFRQYFEKQYQINE